MTTLNRGLTAFVVGVAMLLLPAFAMADVRDNAKKFSQDAIDKANTAMEAIQQKHNKQFVLETFSAVPDDMKDQLQQDGKEAFFKKWMVTRAQELQVNGVYALICFEPNFIEIGAGQNTVKHGDFTAGDITRLRQQLGTALHSQQFDKGLLQATDMVDRTFTANIHSGGNPNPAPNAGSTPPVQQTAPNYPSLPKNIPGSGGGMASWLCIGVGVLVAISLISKLFRSRSGGSGYGGGGGFQQPGPGAGYGGGPGYGGGGYGGGGGGGGFGRGVMGGLLGGVLGGYAADKFSHRNDPSAGTGGGGGIFPESGGGSGGSFDSGPSDAGQGFGDSSSGGDFGSGGGGGGGGGDSSGGSF